MPATHAESGQNNSVHIRRGWYLSRTTKAGNDVVKCRRKTALFIEWERRKTEFPPATVWSYSTDVWTPEGWVYLSHPSKTRAVKTKTVWRVSISVSTHKTTCFLFQRRPVTANISFPTKWVPFYASRRLLSCGPREDLACRLIISKSTWFVTAFVRP